MSAWPPAPFVARPRSGRARRLVGRAGAGRARHPESRRPGGGRPGCCCDGRGCWWRRPAPARCWRRRSRRSRCSSRRRGRRRWRCRPPSVARGTRARPIASRASPGRRWVRRTRSRRSPTSSARRPSGLGSRRRWRAPIRRQRTHVVVLYRDGALDHLDVVEGSPRPGGVWVSDRAVAMTGVGCERPRHARRRADAHRRRLPRPGGRNHRRPVLVRPSARPPPAGTRTSCHHHRS